MVINLLQYCRPSRGMEDRQETTVRRSETMRLLGSPYDPRAPLMALAGDGLREQSRVHDGVRNGGRWFDLVYWEASLNIS